MNTSEKIKNLEIDERGRITLPKELREGVESFSLHVEKDGSLRLIAQRNVSVQEAELIEELKESLAADLTRSSSSSSEEINVVEGLRKFAQEYKKQQARENAKSA